jgi:hypothetical protein
MNPLPSNGRCVQSHYYATGLRSTVIKQKRTTTLGMIHRNCNSQIIAHVLFEANVIETIIIFLIFTINIEVICNSVSCGTWLTF